ncbi:hypothetical protein [Carboxylicivirga sp. M1479]|uniref:hypothetical protein n=1 Tax=Carboxylicivirga sp. M1479 TaxID=2594476 RepID=UPI001178065A|nr:hypothetical protein [Carboxylicivirga sp. M1479]TRX70473.1 hypothetical protein FNN09_10870 [Carboxylicivirga sp. M1479]
MAKIKLNKKSLIRWKIYIDRARMYIGYIQFLMIGFVFLQSFEETNWGALIFDNLLYSIPLLFMLFIVLQLVLGRIDTVLGLREEEMRNASTSNPVMRELLTNIQDLKLEVKQLSEQIKETK